MKKNLGFADKSLRIALAVIVAVLYYTHVISVTWGIILGVLAVVFVFTSFLGFCPLYLPFGINTAKKKINGSPIEGLEFHARAQGRARHLHIGAGGSGSRMAVHCTGWIILPDGYPEHRLLCNR